jgi:predicted tellurium resistance membrane protein TerC
MELFSDTSWVLPLITLFFMELVLGIDNVVFISILVDKLPEEKQQSTMRLGIVLAVTCRIALLFFIGWLISLSDPILYIYTFALSGRDLILFAGGFFLLLKTLLELKQKLYPANGPSEQAAKVYQSIPGIVIQIIFVDLIFSFDSILTAVGLVDSVPMMVFAVIGSTIVVFAFAKRISDFINTHPSIKILALSFLLLIGSYLIFEALHIPFDKSLLYFGMGFAFFNELLNLKFKQTGT